MYSLILLLSIILTGCKEASPLLPNSIKYRMLIDKIDKVEKEYVDKIPKSEYISGALEEMIKDLPPEDQKFFLVATLKWLSEKYPETHKNVLKRTFTGMMKQLDPYSIYLDPRDFQNIIKMGQGEIAGIGLELFEKDAQIEVISPITNSPAAKAGLRSGDIITHINGEPVVIKREAILHKLRGKPGSTVKLTVRRGDAKPFEVVLTREVVDILAVQTALYKEIAYIKINYFAKNTADQIRSYLKTQCPKNIKGIIMDLRQTPGGIFQEGVVVSGLFLPKDKKILIVRSRQERFAKTYLSKEQDYAKGKPLVILINEGTASSAEIVTGCLKDYNRATIIGVTTLGKGSIQDIVPITPASKFGGFKYTVAKFYTPLGSPIHNEGITPHIEVPSENGIQSSYNLNLYSLYEIDSQFRKSVQLLQGKASHG